MNERLTGDLNLSRTLNVTIQICVAHLMDERGLDICPDADGARGAQAHKRHSEGVFARVHAKIVGQKMRDARRKRNVAAGLFNAHDVGVSSQALDVVLANAATAAAGNVVEDARDIDGVCHGLKVLVDALFIGFVVVRRDSEQAICAQALVGERLVEHRGGRV